MMSKTKNDYWLRNVSDECREMASFVTLEIANRMKESEYVESVVNDRMNTTMIGNVNPWSPLTLSHGFPGTILLFGELNKNYPNQGWDHVAHQHLIELKNTINDNGIPNMSLFGGIAGIAFSTTLLSHDRSRYKKFLGEIDEFLLGGLNTLFKDENNRLLVEQGVNPSFYDVIQGITGIGRYLLSNISQPSFGKYLKRILTYLVALTEDITVNGKRVPGWYVPVKYQFLDQDKALYPYGNFNCGLSHGITGPLSLLSLSFSKNIIVEGQKVAIEKIIKWLFYWNHNDEKGAFWPDKVSYEELLDDRLKHKYPTRAAWCYGDPGVARALYLGGVAINDSKPKMAAMDTYKGLANSSVDDLELLAPTFCHGKAGLLQMFSRMSKDSGIFNDTVERLFFFLMESYDSSHPFGFKDIEKQGNNINMLDKVGLLEGVSGTLLSLLGLISTEEPTWDNAFLIS